ncbi:MAG: ABC-2 family transporter protein [Gemmataceae bacterium]
MIETFFLRKCNQFADLVRTGDLDLYLLKPMDKQFLITCRTIDWSCGKRADGLRRDGLMRLIQIGNPVGVSDGFAVSAAARAAV